MKLKIDEATGKAEVQDGKPVYVYDDGKEVAFDAPAAVSTIKRVSDERDGFRDQAGKHGEALKAFGDLDPKAAREALEREKDPNRKKLIDAGEVDKVREELKAVYEPKLKERDDALAAEQAKVRRLTVGSEFSRSPYFVGIDGQKPRTFLPPDLAEKVFGEYFEPAPDGRVIAKVDGRELISREDPSKPASFDEAIGLLIDRHPQKGTFLQDRGGSGAGANGGAAANGNPTKQNMDGLAPEERLARAYAGTGASARR